MPKPPAPQPRGPSAPTQASFMTQGSAPAQSASPGPAKLLNPIVGYSRSNSGIPSLLGGM